MQNVLQTVGKRKRKGLGEEKEKRELKHQTDAPGRTMARARQTLEACTGIFIYLYIVFYNQQRQQQEAQQEQEQEQQLELEQECCGWSLSAFSQFYVPGFNFC